MSGPVDGASRTTSGRGDGRADEDGGTRRGHQGRAGADAVLVEGREGNEVPLGQLRPSNGLGRFNWSEQDVIDIHHRHGLAPNPLYLMGATRVGCWPCIFARKAEIRLVANIDPERIERIRALESEVQAASAARREAAGKPPPTFFHGHQKTTDGTPRPHTPIDTVVSWSRTKHGGKEPLLLDDQPDGCVRWGLCEAPKEETQEVWSYDPTEEEGGYVP